jgi:hypothetical protein
MADWLAAAQFPPGTTGKNRPKILRPPSFFLTMKLSIALRDLLRSFVAGLASLALTGVVRADPAPLRSIRPPDQMYIGNALALSNDGTALAYVITDGNEKTRLHLVDLRDNGQDVDVAAVEGRVDSLRWLGAGRILAVLQAHAGGRLVGRIFEVSGPQPGSIGPADQIGVARFEQRPVITTFDRPPGTSGMYRVAGFDATDLRRVASNNLVVDGRNQTQVHNQTLTLLWYCDDFTRAAVRHPGAYDPTRDIRLPDRFARLDLLSGVLEDDAAIEPGGFAQLVSIQRLHTGKTTFVHFDLDKHKLLLIDGARSRVLVPERPVATYDPNKASAQVIDTDEVIVSLTVDPLNPAAIARKKRDRPELDLYAVVRSTGAMSRLLVIDVGQSPTSWQIGGGKMALLRKHRVFPRGGVALDLYALPTARVANGQH